MLDIISKYPSNFMTIIYQIQKKFTKIYTQTITKISTPYPYKISHPISLQKLAPHILAKFYTPYHGAGLIHHWQEDHENLCPFWHVYIAFL